jgi:hypothetical protein
VALKVFVKSKFVSILSAISLVSSGAIFGIAVPAAQAANSACVSGSDYSSSTSSGYTTLTFSNASACDLVLPTGVTAIDYLTVGAGGGGGGVNYARCANAADEKPGGGGAGGAGGQVNHGESLTVASGATLSVSVGSGGTAGVPSDCTIATSGAGGTGGTGGTSALTVDATEVAASAGGGGGQGGLATGGVGAGGSNAIFSGGTNPSVVNCNDGAREACFAAPGGAGAGAAGASIPPGASISASGGAGGAGVTWSVNSITYGGGGGSNRHPSTQPSTLSRGTGVGGTGGGGNGNLGYGYSGTDGLGGGGGGRGNGSSAANSSNAGGGGAGGRGVVIVRYLEPVSTTLYVVADDQSVFVGDVAPTYTYKLHSGSASGSVVSDPAGLTGLVCTSSYSNSSLVADSTLAITCSGAVADGYTFDYTSGAVTINPLVELFVVADPKSVNFGDAAPSYTYTIHSGSPSGPTVGDPAGLTGLTCTSSYTPATLASESPVSISCTGAAAHGYTFT